MTEEERQRQVVKDFLINHPEFDRNDKNKILEIVNYIDKWKLPFTVEVLEGTHNTLFTNLFPKVYVSKPSSVQKTAEDYQKTSGLYNSLYDSLQNSLQNVLQGNQQNQFLGGNQQGPQEFSGQGAHIPNYLPTEKFIDYQKHIKDWQESLKNKEESKIIVDTPPKIEDNDGIAPVTTGRRIKNVD